MITDTAYSKIKDAFERDKLDDGAFALALTIYQSNFENLTAGGKTARDAEATLLTDVTLTSLKDQGSRLFKARASRAVIGQKIRMGIGGILTNILLNLVSSVIFVLLSIAVVWAMQDTARTFFSSMGLQLAPVNVAVESKDGQPILKEHPSKPQQ